MYYFLLFWLCVIYRFDQLNNCYLTFMLARIVKLFFKKSGQIQDSHTVLNIQTITYYTKIHFKVDLWLLFEVSIVKSTMNNDPYKDYISCFVQLRFEAMEDPVWLVLDSSSLIWTVIIVTRADNELCLQQCVHWNQLRPGGKWGLCCTIPGELPWGAIFNVTLINVKIRLAHNNCFCSVRLNKCTCFSLIYTSIYKLQERLDVCVCVCVSVIRISLELFVQ